MFLFAAVTTMTMPVTRDNIIFNAKMFSSITLSMCQTESELSALRNVGASGITTIINLFIKVFPLINDVQSQFHSTISWTDNNE